MRPDYTKRIDELEMANETLRAENIHLSERLRDMQRIIAMQGDLVERVERLNRENDRLKQASKIQFNQDILSGFDLAAGISTRLN
jgi:hypothetical protein